MKLPESFEAACPYCEERLIIHVRSMSVNIAPIGVMAELNVETSRASKHLAAHYQEGDA